MSETVQRDRQVTVLVVEDEPLILMNAVDLLEDEGFRVLDAPNGDRALEMLEGEAGVQALFTDVDMPGSLDGLALARQVHRRWPEIQIVITSGKMSVPADQVPAGGRFVAKPWNLQQVSTMLREMTDPAPPN